MNTTMNNTMTATMNATMSRLLPSATNMVRLDHTHVLSTFH